MESEFLLRLIKKNLYGPVQAVQMGYSPVGTPLMNVYFYRLGGLVIDTGQRHMQNAARQAMADGSIRHILLTHHHEDHSGNAAALRDLTGATVWGHRITAAKLAGGFHIRPYQHFIWDAARPIPIAPLQGPVASGGYVLTPVETPGHSKDHVVYIEKNNGWLFAGDLFIGERIKFFRVDEDMGSQITSLRKVLKLDFDVLFCAHNPRLKNGRHALSRKLDFLEGLRGKVQDLHCQGYPLQDIIKRLDPKTDRRVKWITMGNASFANMVRSALKSVPDPSPA